MGCDIHAHIEYNRYGRWDQFALVHIDRFYDLFAFMAGSGRRPGIHSVYETRGLPEDADTFYVKPDFEKWRDDAHHTSWLTLTELDAVRTVYIEWYQSHKGCFDRVPNLSEFDATIDAMRALDKAGYKARLVFWFDN